MPSAHQLRPCAGSLPVRVCPFGNRIGHHHPPAGSRCPLGGRCDDEGVIAEIDEALRSLIRRDVPSAAGVDVVLDAPTKDWAARRNAPTIDLYLYDIREDLRRRERGMVNEYESVVERGVSRRQVVGRRLPPRWFKMSYLVTAWTQRPEDEHRLLSDLMTCLLRQDSLPADLLVARDDDGLRVPELAVGLSVGLPPPEDRAFADVWTALGGELKPSLDVVASVPIETGQRRVTGPPVTSEEPVLADLSRRDGGDRWDDGG